MIIESALGTICFIISCGLLVFMVKIMEKWDNFLHNRREQARERKWMMGLGRIK